MPLMIDVELAGAPRRDRYEVIGVPVVREDDVIRHASAPAEELGIDPTLDLAFLEQRGFEAKIGSTLVYEASPGAPTVLLVGLGEGPLGEAEPWRQAAAAFVRSIKQGSALLLVDEDEEALEAAVVGAMLASYRFEISSKPGSETHTHLSLTGSGSGALARGRAIAEAVGFARDLINRPPSELTPSTLAAEAAARLEAAPGVTVEVWDEERIASERLGGLLGVAAGSHQPPRLVRAVYVPDGEPSRHVVLVGKGITFDSGGLSLKTAAGMTSMKTDMTGSAVVLSAMGALAALKVDAKVTVIAPMTENMPGGAAMKPGDILVPRSGPTVEVLNTDAEGRLILADGLSLAVEEDPDLIVDVATLTGAAVVALGKGVGAMLSNSDAAAVEILDAADAAGEHLWRLPLVEEYEAHISSEIADIKNTGAAGEAGTISAALFLQRFVDGRPWVHLDIAGPGRSEKDAGYLSKGGTAFGLMAILRLLRP
jgi:leucyl aminopeptidase